MFGAFAGITGIAVKSGPVAPCTSTSATTENVAPAWPMSTSEPLNFWTAEERSRTKNLAVCSPGFRLIVLSCVAVFPSALTSTILMLMLLLPGLATA